MAEFASISEPETPFVVLAENATAVRIFIAMQSQWRWASLSTLGEARILRTGLVYEAIETICRLTRLELGDGDFHRLQHLEAEALLAWSEEAKG